MESVRRTFFHLCLPHKLGPYLDSTDLWLPFKTYKWQTTENPDAWIISLRHLNSCPCHRGAPKPSLRCCLGFLNGFTVWVPLPTYQTTMHSCAPVVLPGPASVHSSCNHTLCSEASSGLLVRERSRVGLLEGQLLCSVYTPLMLFAMSELPFFQGVI